MGGGGNGDDLPFGLFEGLFSLGQPFANLRQVAFGENDDLGTFEELFVVGL